MSEAGYVELPILARLSGVVLTPGEPAKTVRFIEFDPARQPGGL